MKKIKIEYLERDLTLYIRLNSLALLLLILLLLLVLLLA